MRKVTSRGARLHRLMLALALSFCVLLAGLRSWGVEQSYGFYTQCQGCFAIHALIADGIYFAVMGLGFALSLTLLWRGRWLCFAVIALGLMVYVADVLVFQSFSVRLYVHDVAKFGTQLDALRSVGWDLATRPQLWCTTLLGLAALMFGGMGLGSAAHISSKERARGAIALAISSAVVLLIAVFFPQLSYIEQGSVRNVFQVNQEEGSSVRFSPGFVAALPKQGLPQQCTATITAPPKLARSVIVMTVESLSAYHSALSGAAESKIPKLEALVSANGAWASDFWANGFTTDGGLISVFAGELPIPAPGRYDSTQAFMGFGNTAQGFYQALKKRQYRLAFLNGADLNFLGMGNFFAHLGFQDIEDSSAPIYQTPEFIGTPRGQFGAVNDGALFSRSLMWIKQQRTPFFLGLLTINTHPPFIAPGAREPNHDAAFAYADETISGFVQALATDGYFERGILVITGDHRAMVPISRVERARLGVSAAARVPFFVFGQGAPRGAISGRFQQTDILPTLARQLDESSCTSELIGRIWPSPMPARFRLHANGSMRDRVWVEGVSAQINFFKMQGDASQFVGLDSNSLAKADADRLSLEISRQRAARGEPKADFLGWILGR